MKKVLALILIVFAVLPLFGCSAQKFNKDGITLTLTKDFVEMGLENVEGAHVSYASEKVKVAVFKDEYTVSKNIRLREYASEWMIANKVFIVGDVKEEDGIVSVAYKVTYLEKTHIVYTAFYDRPGAFWVVQFFCLEEDYKEYEPYFETWASKVEFK